MTKIHLLKKQILIIIGLTLLSGLIFAGQASAVFITPANLDFTAKPGDVIRGKLKVGNSETTPHQLNVFVSDYIINPETGIRKFIDDSAPRGLKDWIELDAKSPIADPDEKVDFNYKITVPESAAPGTYMSAFLASATIPANDDEGSRVGVAGRVVSLISLTIEGDYNEELSLKSFKLNKKKFLQGNIVFNVEVKNLGDVKTVPFGQITIYDGNGDLVEGVYAITNEFEGKEVVIDRKDEIPVNVSKSVVMPGTTHTIDVEWKNRDVATGNYTAKLALYYGQDNTKLEAETDFEIVENFTLTELTPEAFFKSSLPISFDIKLQNTGNQSVEPSGYFEITNIFGAQKKRIDLTKEELKVPSGEEKSLNNLIWDSGFALGLYKANLYLDVGGNTYTKSATFWIISWWQAIIVVLVLLILIFILYKGVHGYRVMKEKIKIIEKDK